MDSKNFNNLFRRAERFSKMFWFTLSPPDDHGVSVLYVYRASDRHNVEGSGKVPGVFMDVNALDDNRELMRFNIEFLIDKYVEMFIEQPWERGL